MNIKNKTPFRSQISLKTFFVHNGLAFFIGKTTEDMRSARAFQQNNYHCYHDQSERAFTKGLGSRLNTKFIINAFQDSGHTYRKTIS